ncbi:MAG TPA: class I SAM-dependent methyltransferase [Candidatus Acidoferrales bacterium]|nr:class I SAM-dependent methyltransferase [Candidatus Acidoferrales bacterium]
MPSPHPAKVQKFREQLHHEWTSHETIAAWKKWHSHLANFTIPVTQSLLAAAQLRPGMDVLDLASGVGDPALSLAAAVAPTGRVTATDLNPAMLAFVEEQARRRSITNMDFREASAEALPFPDSSFDALTCRFGIMFFPDLEHSLRECLRVLKSGARVTFIAWGRREQPFFATTGAILMKYVELPPPDPEAPNIAMFGEPARMRSALESAGFTNVYEEFRTVEGRWQGSVDEYWQQFSEVAAPFRVILNQLSPESKTQAINEIKSALKKFQADNDLVLPLEIVIGTGVRS